MGAAGHQLTSAGGEDYLVAKCKLPSKTFLKADIQTHICHTFKVTIERGLLLVVQYKNTLMTCSDQATGLCF